MIAKHFARALTMAAIAALAAACPAAALTIVAPASGATVTPGATVLVTVAPSAAEGTPSAVMAGMSSEGLVGATASASVPGAFDANITVPAGFVGPAFIVAVAQLADGTTALDYVRVTVDPGTLRALVVAAPPAMGIVGQVVPLSVKGTFDDGVVRDISLPERGTTYASSDETVLGIHPNGLIQARASGIARVTASNRGKSATTVVIVSASASGNHIPAADAGADQTVAPLTAVTLSAAASADPDGDALTYQWQQESGRIVTLVGEQTAQPTFISPRVDAPETLTFSLVVTDSKQATTFPAIVHVTVTP
jgi:hypothetical protein